MRVLVCGPDGSGKSALASALVEELQLVEHAHFRRRLRSSADPRRSLVPAMPGVEPPRSTFGAVLKVLYFAIVNLLAEAVRPTGRGERHLVMERGWHDQLVHRERYRLPPHLDALVSTLGRLQPRYDLALLCVGDPKAIHARKPELPASVIEDQICMWNRKIGSIASSVVVIDTVVHDRDTAVEMAVSAARRSRRPPVWKSIPIRPRRMWIGVRGGATSAGLVPDLYTPKRGVFRAVVRAQLAFPALLPRLESRHVDRLETVVQGLGRESDPVAAIASSSRGRVVARLGVAERARYIKVGPPDDEGLRNELAMLRRHVGETGFPVLDVAFETKTLIAIVTHPALRTRECDAADGLAAVMTLQRANLSHGDLAPWNLAANEHDVVLLDLEQASSPHVPFVDLAVYLTRLGGRLGAMTAAQAASWADASSAALQGYAKRCNPASPGWRHAMAQQLKNGCIASPSETSWAEALADELLRGEPENA